jgi:hypothetical protein
MQYSYLREIKVFKIIYSNVLIFIEKNPTLWIDIFTNNPLFEILGLQQLIQD